MKRLQIFAAVTVLSLVGSGLLLGQNTQKDPFVGRWRLDRTKSKYVNAQRPQNDLVMTVEAQGVESKETKESLGSSVIGEANRFCGRAIVFIGNTKPTGKAHDCKARHGRKCAMKHP